MRKIRNLYKQLIFTYSQKKQMEAQKFNTQSCQEFVEKVFT